MQNSLEEVLFELTSNISSDEFIDKCEDIIDSLSSYDIEKVVLGLLGVFEENPEADFGAPGPLVRFLESCPAEIYDVNIINSVKVKPTMHTLWMFNRLINSVDGHEKVALVSDLESISLNQTFSKEIQSFAKSLLEYQ